MTSSITEEFIEGDPLHFDITERRTFAIASILAVVFGAAIGLGYNLIFTQFPDLNTMQRLNIMVITILAGVGAGIAPAMIKEYLYCRKHGIPFGQSQDDDDDETE